jgi:hypothetical protein
MKRINLLFCFLLLLGVRVTSTGQDSHPPGEIHWQGILATSALAIYKELTHAELIVDSRAQQIGTAIFLETEKPVSDAEATKLIKRAFLEQAGLVITHLDGERVSVTYNDALPIKKGKKSSR